MDAGVAVAVGSRIGTSRGKTKLAGAGRTVHYDATRWGDKGW